MHMLARSFVLLLWTQTLTFVKCQDCTLQQFVNSPDFDQNFDTTGMSATYGAGKQVRVPCNTGYTGFFKLICTEGKWKPVGSKCEAKPCGHPGDAQFADFNLQNGEDFVFGSQVVYTCHQGYHMVSRSNTRRCVADGWDGVVPVCEAIKCPVIHVNNNVQMIGDPEEATFGNVVRFTCRSNSEVLSGSTEIYCNDKGEWKGTVPTCKEVRCPIPVVQHGHVDGAHQEYKENDLLLNFRCDQGYELTDKRYPKCSKTGDRAEWIPTPACKVITCELFLPPMSGTRYDTQNKNVFSPGETVRVTCGENYWIVNSQTMQTVVTCKEDGEWSADPVCKEVTCPEYLPNDHLYRNVNAWRNNKLGNRVWYDCASNYKKTDNVQYATCTRAGWTPKPLCKETKCPSPELENADIIRGRKTYYPYYDGDRVEYRCRNGGQATFIATCEEGTWTGTKSCLVRQCSGPEFLNAEITSGAKYNYYSGDRVIYRCRTGAQKSFTATCEDGTWTEDKGCLACTKPDIPNGFAVAPFNNSVIYYSCDENYKLFTKGWWAEATCVDGQWSDLHQCIDKGSCGEAPVIPNGRGERVETPGRPASLKIVCNEGYRAGRNQLTCLSGTWNLQGLELNTMCSLDGKSCNRPPYVENAIINGPNQMVHSPGSSVIYQCREKYTTKTHDTITCQDGKWEKKNIICVKYCEILKDVKLTVTTSDVKEKYLEEETINYVCNAPGAKTEELAICANGTWVNSVDCPAIPCQVDVLSPGLGISGTQPSNNRVTSGEKLSFFCGGEFDLEGSAETECLETGQWSLPLPTCSKKCKILQLPENVIITKPTGGYSRSKGQKITFGCRQRGHTIDGNETTECLGNGEWSSQPPTCGRTEGCGTPPTLTDGDTEGFTKSSYDNGETVTYACFSKYVMDGGPTKTCNNGAWTGTMRCMKPCTVNNDLMNRHNIQFALTDKDKLYAPHKDHLTFACKRGTSRVGSRSMRRQCLDGEMELPTCREV